MSSVKTWTPPPFENSWLKELSELKSWLSDQEFGKLSWLSSLFVKPKINCFEAFLQKFRLRRASIQAFISKFFACGTPLFRLLFQKKSPAAPFYACFYFNFFRLRRASIQALFHFFPCSALLFRLLFQNFSLRRASIEAFISKKKTPSWCNALIVLLVTSFGSAAVSTH